MVWKGPKAVEGKREQEADKGLTIATIFPQVGVAKGRVAPWCGVQYGTPWSRTNPVGPKVAAEG